MDEAAQRRRGVLELIGAAAAFSVMSLLVKLAAERLPSAMIVEARAVATLVLSYAWLKRAGLSPRGNARRWLVLRGVFGFLGLTCFFTAVARLPLAEATILHFLNPVFTAVLAAFVLKERLRPVLVVALLVCLAGTALVVDPRGGALDLIGVAAALGGAVASAFAYVTVRHLRGRDDPLVVVFWFSLVAVPAGLPLAAPVFVLPTAREWALLAAVGVVTQLGQVFITRGLAKVEAGPATTIGYLQILFAATFGVVFLDEPLRSTTIAGALLVFFGTALVAIRPSPPPTPPTEA